MTATEYQSFLANHPDIRESRMRRIDMLAMREAERRLIETTERLRPSGETLGDDFQEKLPIVLQRLRAPEGPGADRMNELRGLLGTRFDYGNEPVSGDAVTKVPQLMQFIQARFDEASMSRRLNVLELSRALSEMMSVSFTTITGSGREQAYHQELEKFTRPFLRAALQDYFNRHYPPQTQEDRDTNERRVNAVLGHAMMELESIHIGNPPSEYVQAGTYFLSMIGRELPSAEHSDLRRVQALGVNYIPAPGPGQNQDGIIYPVNAQLSPRQDQPEWQQHLARFWMEMISPFPPREQGTDTFFPLLAEEVPDPLYYGYQPNLGRQKIHTVLRSPLALSLVRFAPSFMTPTEVTALTHIYTTEGNGTTHNVTPEDLEGWNATRKFFEFCQSVREAELAGLTEMPIGDTGYTLLLDVNLRMGVYARSGNVSALLNENFRIRVNRTGEIFMASAEGFVPMNIVREERHDMDVL